MTDSAALPVWDSVGDDTLSRAGEAADFLQGFCPPGADPVWSASAFAWKLGPANPAGPGFLSLGLCEDKVVATTSITLKRLWIDGREVIGGEIGDTYTAAAFRRGGQPRHLAAGNSDAKAYVNRSIFGRLVSETSGRAHKAGIGIIYGTPNANSMPGYVKRLGFHEMRGHVNANFLRPSLGNLARRAGLAALPVAELDRLATWIGRTIAQVLTPGMSVEEITHPGDDIDGLWHQLRGGLDFAPVRDSRWFQHRFLDHPLVHYRLLALRRRGRLQAVAVIRRFVTVSGRPFCYVADWLAPADRRVLMRVLAEAAWRDSGGTDGVLLWAGADSVAASAARASLFLRRPASPIILAGTPAGLDLLAGRPCVDFTLAASDNV